MVVVLLHGWTHLYLVLSCNLPIAPTIYRPSNAWPPPSASLPVVRTYREVMARLYDEPPSPQGLAGFIAARYTAEVLASVTGPLHRASALAAFRKRSAVQVGGFVVAYEGRRLATTHVTQSMLTTDGRIVG